MWGNTGDGPGRRCFTYPDGPASWCNQTRPRKAIGYLKGKEAHCGWPRFATALVLYSTGTGS